MHIPSHRHLHEIPQPRVDTRRLAARFDQPFPRLSLAHEYDERRKILLGYRDRTGLKYTQPQGRPFRDARRFTVRERQRRRIRRWITKESGVAPVPRSEFFHTPEHRYVRVNFVKRAETLHAAGERY